MHVIERGSKIVNDLDKGILWQLMLKTFVTFNYNVANLEPV